MIVLAASVLIAHLEGGDPHHRRATDLLTESVEEEFAASPLTLAEVLVGPARTDQLANAQAALRELGVVAVPLDDDAPARLAALRASTRLKLPDCCVLLAAQEGAQCAIATFDDRLAAAADSLGHRVHQ